MRKLPTKEGGGRTTPSPASWPPHEGGDEPGAVLARPQGERGGERHEAPEASTRPRPAGPPAGAVPRSRRGVGPEHQGTAPRAGPPRRGAARRAASSGRGAAGPGRYPAERSGSRRQARGSTTPPWRGARRRRRGSARPPPSRGRRRRASDHGVDAEPQHRPPVVDPPGLAPGLAAAPAKRSASRSRGRNRGGAEPRRAAPRTIGRRTPCPVPAPASRDRAVGRGTGSAGRVAAPPASGRADRAGSRAGRSRVAAATHRPARS